MRGDMDNYLGIEAFTDASNKAPVRRVLRGGIIHMDGRIYRHRDLKPLAGQYVRAFLDLGGADAVCLTLFDREFICNAHNPELWEAMIAENR